MTDTPTPFTETVLRSFAHERRGSWLAHADEALDLAEEFHEASKMRAGFPGQIVGPAGVRLTAGPDSHLALGRKALTWTGPRIELPPPHDVADDLLLLARRRRSGLPARCEPITLEDLSTVLAVAAGPVPGRPDLRVCPSAGALFPLDVIVVAHAVRGLARATFVYDPVGHALLPRGETNPDVFHTEVGETIAPNQPSLTLALVATFTRSRAKYGLRGYRFSLLEAGHVAQSALLAATALGLASLPWGGFIDDAADRLLELDGLDRSCVYLVGLSAEVSP